MYCLQTPKHSFLEVIGNLSRYHLKCIVSEQALEFESESGNFDKSKNGGHTTYNIH
jgi:hypothetical protein